MCQLLTFESWIRYLKELTRRENTTACHVIGGFSYFRKIAIFSGALFKSDLLMTRCLRGRHILRIVKKKFNSECEFYLPFVNILSLCNCNDLIQYQFSEVMKQTSSEKYKLAIIIHYHRNSLRAACKNFCDWGF